MQVSAVSNASFAPAHRARHTGAEGMDSSQYWAAVHVAVPQRTSGWQTPPTSRKPSRHAPHDPTPSVVPQTRFSAAHASEFGNPGAHVGSAEQPGLTHATQVEVADTHR
jgi:hypothetical protein